LGWGVNACRKLGPWRPSPGTSGGPCGRRSGASLGDDGGTCWWKAPWACEAASFGWGAGKQVLALVDGLGMPGTGHGQRHGASASRAIGLERGRKRPPEPERGTPRIPSGVMVRQQLAAAAPTARSIQGWRRQQWQSSAAEGGLGWKAGLPLSRKREDGRGRRKAKAGRLGMAWLSGYS
jgi:hypothetical protein